MNEGCTPTKTLITSGRVAYLTRRGQDYGIHVKGDTAAKGNSVQIDMLKIRQRKRDIVNSFRGGGEKRAQDSGSNVLMGRARFIDAKTLKVSMNDGSERIVEGEKIFINVGERPSPPVLSGIDTVPKEIVLDSTSIQELDQVPEHLVVVGGGYVGVEFAQLFRRLRAKVTILQRGKQLLPREDADIAAGLHKILVDEGIQIFLNSTASSISPIASRTESGFVLKLRAGSAEESTIQGSHILFAAGRVPNSDTLDLHTAGVNVDAKGYVKTDAYLATNVPHIFALGDVKGPPAFTHISYDDFRILEENQIKHPSSQPTKSTKDRLVPYVVYT